MQFNNKIAFAAAFAASVAFGVSNAHAAETPKANSHPTCEAAQAWFTKAYGSKATYGEMEVKTTTGKSCTVSFGQKDFIPPQSPSLDLSSCAKAQESLGKVLTGEGKATITTTVAGKPCTLSK